MGEMKKFSELTSAEFWQWWGRTSPKHDPRYKDAVPPGGWSYAKKGGSKVKKKRTKVYPKETVWSWHEL